MDTQEKFWLTTWAIAAFTIIVISAMITANAQNARIAMIDMVRAGADPIAASCALDATATNDVCLLAQRK